MRLVLQDADKFDPGHECQLRVFLACRLKLKSPLLQVLNLAKRKNIQENDVGLSKFTLSFGFDHVSGELG